MFTFKAQDKSNAKRFLTKTCKIDNVEEYLTQHEGKWGTWVLDGKPVPFQYVRDTQAPAAQEAPAATPAPVAPVAEEQAEEPAPSPEASAFGAFALGQLTGTPAAEPAPAPAPTSRARREAASTTGLKIQKDRETRNGVQRQSDGSVGARLWALFDSVGKDCTLVQARALAEAHGLSTTSAAIALYRWRRFNGFDKAQG